MYQLWLVNGVGWGGGMGGSCPPLSACLPLPPPKYVAPAKTDKAFSSFVIYVHVYCFFHVTVGLYLRIMDLLLSIQLNALDSHTLNTFKTLRPRKTLTIFSTFRKRKFYNPERKKKHIHNFVYTELDVGSRAQTLLQYRFPNKLKEIIYFGKSKQINKW